MSKRKTLIEWQYQSDSIYNSEFKILEEPKNASDKVKVLHKKCNNILLITMANHVHRYCKFCNNKFKKSKKDWQELSNNIHNNEYSILEDPINGKNKIKLLHKKCNNTFYMSLNNHINHKQKCPCCGIYSHKSNFYWNEKSKEIFGDEYEILEEIKNVNILVKIKHNKCGNIFLKNMNSFIHGMRGCSSCYQNFPKTDIKYWQEQIDKFHGKNNYIILESPKNINSFISIKHHVCGNIYKTTPRIIKKGCGCSICNLSKGNIEIKKILDEYKIEYISEKKFEDCKNIFELPFDFYLPKYNMCIEYDGIQHFESIKYFGGDISLKKQQLRDNIKNIFCKLQNINLLRIKYTDLKKIKEIICQQLQKQEHQQN